MFEKAVITTKDNVRIAGDYYAAVRKDAPAVILLHMMPATKESWTSFAEKLRVAGFQALAIDERGHGESRAQTRGVREIELDYTTFSDEEQQAKKWDVEAARDFFIGKGVLPENLAVGGASIGANLAIQYLAEHAEARAAFALSPGINYRGLETIPFMEQLGGNQHIFIAAAQDDARAAESADAAAQELFSRGRAQKKLRIYPSGGHGTDMFAVHPECMDELVDWLRAIYF